MVDKKMKDLEAVAKAVENGTSFDKVTKDFGEAAKLVKEILAETKETRGRVSEIIKDVDGYIEKIMTDEDDDN